jgi:flagellar basal-body rod protein FlgC
MVKLIIIIAMFCISTPALAGTLLHALSTSASGLRAQSERMKVIAQNIANSDSTATNPGEEPYRRKMIFFRNEVDPKTGANVVVVDKINRDLKSSFKSRYDPYHPAANAEGYVLLSNVKRNIESLDMKEAERSYQANLGAIDTSKNMFMNTIDLLR